MVQSAFMPEHIMIGITNRSHLASNIPDISALQSKGSRVMQICTGVPQGCDPADQHGSWRKIVSVLQSLYRMPGATNGQRFCLSRVLTCKPYQFPPREKKCKIV
jgi:hypothetical protein